MKESCDAVKISRFDFAGAGSAAGALGVGTFMTGAVMGAAAASEAALVSATGGTGSGGGVKATGRAFD